MKWNPPIRLLLGLKSVLYGNLAARSKQYSYSCRQRIWPQSHCQNTWKLSDKNWRKKVTGRISGAIFYIFVSLPKTEELKVCNWEHGSRFYGELEHLNGKVTMKIAEEQCRTIRNGNQSTEESTGHSKERSRSVRWSKSVFSSIQQMFQVNLWHAFVRSARNVEMARPGLLLWRTVKEELRACQGTLHAIQENHLLRTFPLQ